MTDETLSWIPPVFRVVESTTEYLTGWVDNELDANSVLEAHKRSTLCSFVSWSDDLKKKEKSGRRLLWKYEGVPVSTSPFTVDRTKVYTCQYGKQRKKKTKTAEDGQATDHKYGRGRKRFLIQTTKKVDCAAKIFIRYITRYDGYRLPVDAGRNQRRSFLEVLNDKLDNGTVTGDRTILIKLPLCPAHTQHTVSLESGLSKSIHPKLKEQIKQHVNLGVTSVAYIKRMLKKYVEEDMCQSGLIPPSDHDRTYYPSNRDIYNCIHAALVAGQYSSFDQENLAKKLASWKEEKPDEKFFFRMCSGDTACSKSTLKKSAAIFETSSDDEEDTSTEQEGVDLQERNTFLWVHQSNDQRKLLHKYGNMILLDATYKTTKYALPLFLLVVRTNVSYIPVGEFIIESETAENIAEALQIFKAWNKTWAPKHFMVDYSDVEYQALQSVFPAATKYLCYFHVEQAWIRWTRQREKHGLTDDDRDILLSQLRRMAGATRKPDFDEAVEALVTSSVYTRNQKVQSYLNRYWLNIPERWCRAFFTEGFHTSVTTNNGVEALNNSLKNFYTKLTSVGLLTSLVDILVKDFVPDQIRNYITLNYKSSSQYRSYNQIIPTFLHNKPRSVVKHCLQRYASAACYSSNDVDCLGAGNILVKSEASDISFYSVTLGSESASPSCTCADFIRWYLPCKHMFAVFRHTDFGWDDLSKSYRESPYLNLDSTFLSADVLNSITTAEIVNEDPLTGLTQEQTQEEETAEKQLENSLLRNGRSLRNNISTLNDLSFLSKCADTLSETNQTVLQLIDTLRKTVAYSDSLPLHQGKTAKQQMTKSRALPTRKRRGRQKTRSAKKTKLSISEPNLSGVKSEKIEVSQDDYTQVYEEDDRGKMAEMTDQTETSPDDVISEDAAVAGGPEVPIKGILKKPGFRCKTCGDSFNKRSHLVAHCCCVTDKHATPSVRRVHFQENSESLLRELERVDCRTMQLPKKWKGGRLHVSGEVLEERDIKTLTFPNWLNDKVINAFLATIQRKKNEGNDEHVFVMPSYMAVLWQNGRHDHWLYRKVKLAYYKWVLLPINVNQNHWVLMAANIPNMQVSVVDSLHGDNSQFIAHWKKFMQIRSCETGELNGKWTTVEIHSAKQTDGNSCGAFVLMNALGLLRKVCLVDLTNRHAVAMRKFAMSTLLENAKSPPSQRTICDMVGCVRPHRETSWVMCDVCGRWSHFTCVDISKAPDGHFICLICSAQYS